MHLAKLREIVGKFKYKEMGLFKYSDIILESYSFAYTEKGLSNSWPKTLGWILLLVRGRSIPGLISVGQFVRN